MNSVVQRRARGTPRVATKNPFAAARLIPISSLGASALVPVVPSAVRATTTLDEKDAQARRELATLDRLLGRPSVPAQRNEIELQ